MRVSACVIAKNEEMNIGRCLESMKGYVDEFIVVDTGSEDRTKEIARSYGAHIYTFSWENNFSKAKNYAIDKANGDWIIFLDADEYFSDRTSLENAIKYMKLHLQNEVDGFLCRIINIDMDRNNHELSSFINLRIFKNSPVLRYKHEIHEELFNSNRKLNLIVVNDEVEIFHTGYSTSIIEKKLRRNLQIIMDDIEKNGENKRYYRYLLDCYHGLKEYDKAVKYAKLHIESGEIILGSQNTLYEKMIASMMAGQHEFSEIKSTIKKAICEFSMDPVFYFQYASLHMLHKDYDVAIRYFLKSLDINKRREKINSDLFTNKIYIIQMWMGEIFQIKNELEKAMHAYAESLTINKYNPVPLKALYKMFSSEPEAEVISFLNQIYRREKKSDMEFIVRELGTCPLNKVYFYYQRILSEEFKVNSSLDRERSLMSVGKYDLLINENELPICIDVKILAVSLIALGKKEDMMEIIKRLPEDFSYVVQAYYDCSIRLSEVHFDIYMDLLRELILLKRDELGRMIECAELFTNEQKKYAAAILMNHKLYKEAITLYQHLSADENNAKDQTVIVEIAYCYYYQGLYEESKKNFQSAIQNGCSEGKILQFYKWCELKLN